MNSDPLLKREDIWCLLSDLYLDTEFDERDAKYKARLRQIDRAKYLVKESWFMVKSYIQSLT